MKKFLQGQRALSPSRVAATVAVIAVCATLILVANDIRSTAKDSQRLAKHAVATERSVLTAIVAGCHARLVYDSRFVQATRDDLGTYQASLRLQRAQITNPLIANDPQLLATAKAGITLLEHAVAQKQAIVDKGVINNCGKYERLLAQLPAEDQP